MGGRLRVRFIMYVWFVLHLQPHNSVMQMLLVLVSGFTAISLLAVATSAHMRPHCTTGALEIKSTGNASCER